MSEENTMVVIYDDYIRQLDEAVFTTVGERNLCNIDGYLFEMNNGEWLSINDANDLAMMSILEELGINFTVRVREIIHEPVVTELDDEELMDHEPAHQITQDEKMSEYFINLRLKGDMYD